MRDIIFRAKRLDNQEWVYGYIYHYQAPIAITLSIDVWRITECGTNATTYDIDLKTICQATGIKDSTGKMIYEYDILQYPDQKVGVVHWKDNLAGFHTDDYQTIEKEMTIIGNIFDNPNYIIK